MCFHIYCHINHKAKVWKQAKCPSTDDSMMKTRCIQTMEKMFSFDRSRGTEEVNLEGTDLQLEDE